MQPTGFGLGNVLAQIRVAVVVADAATGRIVLWDSTAQALFGYTEAEALTRVLDDLIPERVKSLQHDGGAWYRADAVHEEPTQYVREIPAVCRDGTEFVAEFTFSQFGSLHDRQLAIRIRDSAQVRQIEAQLQQAQRLEAVGLLAGGVAHDFNNLLQAIVGFSELALLHIDPSDAPYRFVEEIARAGVRGAALTRQLLAFGRRQRRQPEILNINDILRSLEQTVKALVGIRIPVTMKLDPSLDETEADPAQLEQIIINLATNARDAMPNGGKLHVETRKVLLTAEDVIGRPMMFPGRYTLLLVRDNGQGMDAETQAHVFEPFFTTKEQGQGTGLGLASVFGIVKESGGFIWVTSQIAVGTSFEIYFPPAVGRKAQRFKMNEGPLIPRATAATVLVVDDEPAVGALARAALEARHYRVLQASHGEEALQLAGAYKGRIHLLVTDVLMPGMSGPDIAERLCAQREDIRVLFISGYSRQLLESSRAGARPVAYLQKPFTPAELVTKVADICAAPYGGTGEV